MKSTKVGLFALLLFVGHAHAFIEVMVEIMPYREKKETAEGASKLPGSGGGAVPVPAIATRSAKAGENQEKMMVISVRNASKRAENELTVRYWFIGRDMKTMRSLIIDGGEASADLKPNATMNVTSDPVKGTVSRTMISPGRLGPATGIKVAGYAVQVIKAGRVIGEAFQEPIYKKLIGSEGKTPGPFFQSTPPGETQ
jgi:hypothetical protein